MQSMSSMEVDPLISVYTPLTQIIIPELDTQQTLNNTLNIQMGPLVNPPDIVVEDHILQVLKLQDWRSQQKVI
jgi:hypothetical protein